METLMLHLSTTVSEAAHIGACGPQRQTDILDHPLTLCVRQCGSCILQMTCFCDHSWMPSHDCRTVPMSPRRDDFPLPYACPHDFIFEPDRMLDDRCVRLIAGRQLVQNPAQLLLRMFSGELTPPLHLSASTMR